MDSKRTGKTISNLRKSLNFTQGQLAEKINVSDKAISKWETGEGLPEITNLIELSKIFNVTIDYIINGEGADIILGAKTVDNKSNAITPIIPIVPANPLVSDSKTDDERIDKILKEVDNEIKTSKTNKNASGQNQEAPVLNTPQNVDTGNFKKSISSALIINIILSAVSILLTIFVNGIIGLVLAIIALVSNKKIKATSDFENELKTTSKIIATISLVISLISALITLIVLIVFGSIYGSMFDVFRQAISQIPTNFNF